MSRYAPSRAKITEYLKKKKCQDIDDFLTEIGYDETLMISMWMRSFLSLGKGKREIQLKLMKKWYSRDLIAEYLSRNTEELQDWDMQKSALVRQIDTLIARGKSVRMIGVMVIPKYPYFRDEIEELLSELSDIHSLEKEVQKYKNRYNVHDPKDREKLIAALLRKGFEYSSIKEQLTINNQ